MEFESLERKHSRIAIRCQTVDSPMDKTEAFQSLSSSLQSFLSFVGVPGMTFGEESIKYHVNSEISASESFSSVSTSSPNSTHNSLERGIQDNEAINIWRHSSQEGPQVLCPPDIEESYPGCPVFVTDESFVVQWFSCAFIREVLSLVDQKTSQRINAIDSTNGLSALSSFYFCSSPKDFPKPVLLWEFDLTKQQWEAKELEVASHPDLQVIHDLIRARTAESEPITSAVIVSKLLQLDSDPISHNEFMEFIDSNRCSWTPAIFCDLNFNALWSSNSFELMTTLPQSQWKQSSLALKKLAENGLEDSLKDAIGKRQCIKFECLKDLKPSTARVSGRANLITWSGSDISTVEFREGPVIGLRVDMPEATNSNSMEEKLVPVGFLWLFVKTLDAAKTASSQLSLHSQ